jgi:hypothetical protein
VGRRALGSTVPNQPPDRFAQTIAVDASGALERDPSLDIEAISAGILTRCAAVLRRHG